jgi:hypothetical protein
MVSPGSNALSSSFRVISSTISRVFVPKYCTLEELGRWLTMDVTDDSLPNTDMVLELLQSAEAYVDAREWGRYTQVNELLDGKYEYLSFNWQYTGFFTQIFYPQHINIIRIRKAFVNTGGLQAGDHIWTEVLEGPASGSSFLVLRKAVLTRQIGSSLLFYTNTPYPGPLRLQLTYDYGMDVEEALLREFVAKQAAMKCLEVRAAAEGQNVNLSTGPWAAIYKLWSAWCERMEEKVFPKKVRKVFVFPSTA